MSAHLDFLKKLEKARFSDPRYKEDSYLFVMSALDKTLGRFDKPRHVSGQELLASIRSEAREQFGPMAASVFEYWGIKNSFDFGHIVFNMVREGILSKTESDSLSDFENTVFFENLFDTVSGYRLRDEENQLKNLIK